MPTRIRIAHDLKEFGLKAGDELITPNDPESIALKGKGIYIPDPRSKLEKVWLYSFEFEEIDMLPW